MNVILVALGATGDVHPMIALGRALGSRGHRVSMVANPYFEPVARAVGLDFIGLGSAEPFRNAMRGVGARTARQRLARALASASWASQSMVRWRERARGVVHPTRPLYEMLRTHVVPGRTVVAARAQHFAARIAQEALGVPLATIHVQPAMIRSVYDAPGLPLPDSHGQLARTVRRATWRAIDAYADRLVVPDTNAFRSELSLPPVRRPFSGWVHSPDLVIGLFPDWYAAVEPDWPRNTRLTGFPLFDEAGVKELPPGLEAFLDAGEPPIVFTAGSGFRHLARFFDVAVRACRILRKRGLLLTEWSEFVPRDLPGTIRHFGYVPFSRVLPRAAAVVHHGGIGTAALAFAAGVPQLVVPFVDDQLDNAVRIERLGAGVAMSRHWFRPARVARTLDAMLRSEAVSRSCRSIAARLQQEDPCAEASRLIETLHAAQPVDPRVTRGHGSPTLGR